MTDKHTLVERLRYHGEDHGNGMLLHAVLFAEAATRITTLEAREAELVEALQEIADRHIPDQPAACGGDELEWAIRQYRALRSLARATLAKHQEGE